jgi:putative hydrolase of the HAD superfamily
MGPIEAVIFDWGGVLIENPAPALMRYAAETLGVDVPAYLTVHNKHGEAFQKGHIEEAMFWQRVCGDLDRPVPQVPSLWGDAYRASYAARAEVFNLAMRLREHGYKTALLTNTEPPVMQFWHEQKYDMFDALVFSCAEGSCKPQAEIYHIAAERLGIPVERCVLIDDKHDSIDGATEVGMNGIVYESLEQVEEALQELGVSIWEGR